MTIVKLALAVHDNYAKTATGLLSLISKAMIDQGGATQSVLTDYPDDSGDGLGDRSRRERAKVLWKAAEAANERDKARFLAEREIALQNERAMMRPGDISALLDASKQN